MNCAAGTTATTNKPTAAAAVAATAAGAKPAPGLGALLDSLGVRSRDRTAHGKEPCAVCSCPVEIVADNDGKIKSSSDTSSSTTSNVNRFNGRGAAISATVGAADAAALTPCVDVDAEALTILTASRNTALSAAGVGAAYTATAQKKGAAATRAAGVDVVGRVAAAESGVVLLAYKYTPLKDPKAVQDWQIALCTKLNLKGKIKIGVEGINLTCAGTVEDTTAYIAEVCSSSFFARIIHPGDFKRSTYSLPASSSPPLLGVSSTPSTSSPSPAPSNTCAPAPALAPGTASAAASASASASASAPQVEQHPFDALKVSLVEEIISLGVAPNTFPASSAGKHLKPSEFHNMLSTARSDVITIDCRNDYESKVGKFTNAVAPQVRKFSQWTDWTRRNASMLQDKTVLMYVCGNSPNIRPFLAFFLWWWGGGFAL